MTRKWLTLWAAVGFLLSQSLWGGQAVAQTFDGEIIDEVRVEGNRKIETDAILQSVHSRVGQPLRRSQVRKDIKDVYMMGYFRDVDVLVDQSTNGISLIVKVSEKPAIKGIQYEGNDKVNVEDLQEVVSLRLYTILDGHKIQDNIQRLRSLYAEKGYFLADVSYELRPIGNSGDVSVVFVINEGQKILVKRMYFVGDQKLDSKEFERYLTNQNAGYMYWIGTSGTFSEEAVEDDALTISAYYIDQGYVQVRVETPEVYLSPDRTYLAITHRIHEGERFKVSGVSVAGELLGTEEELMDLVSLENDEWFSRTLLAEDLQKLSDHYADLGYAFAEVIPLTDVDEEAKTIDITYRLTKNTQVYLNQIHIGGNTVTWDKTIRRELPLSEGELFKGSIIKTGKRRLERLGYFEEVQITSPRVGDDKLDLNVQVKERPTGTFNIGAGLSSVESFVFTANVSKQNFLGLGYQMGVAASVSGVRRQLNLNFYDPYFLDTRWTMRVDGYEIQDNIYQDEERRGGGLAFGHWVGNNDDANFQIRYSLEKQTVGNISEYLEQLYGGQLFRSGLSSSLEGTFILDKRNNRITPTGGYLFRWSSELAGGLAVGDSGDFLNLLGGDFNFHRHQVNFRFYHPIVAKNPEAVVFRVNTSAGMVFSTDGTMLPLLERFRAGGINSVRGYQVLSLGPTIRYLDNYEPSHRDEPRTVGGYQVLTSNWEVEFGILASAGIRGVVFFDVGNAFDLFEYDVLDGTDPEEVRADKLPRMAAGFGIRWFSPMGPLRFEWGYPIDRRGDEEPSQFEFTIGSFF